VREYELGALGFISPVDTTEPFKGGRNLLTPPSPILSYLSSDATRPEMLTAPSNVSIIQLRRPLTGTATAVPLQEVHPTPGMPLRVVLFSALELSRQELDVRVIALSDRTVTVRADSGGACGMVGSPLFADGRKGTAAPVAIVTAVEQDRCVASRLDRSSPWMREVLK